VEISNIWRRPKSTSAIFFVLNRYISIISNVFVTVFNFDTVSLQSCKQFSLFHQLLLVANQVFVCVLLTLRTWALYGCNIRILLFMIGCGASLLGVASWSLVGQQNTFPTITAGCHMALSEETGIHIAVAWEALFVYDTLVVALTLRKTYNARPQHNFTSIRRIDIISLVLRDGAVYYAVMAMANLANLLTFYMPSSKAVYLHLPAA